MVTQELKTIFNGSLEFGSIKSYNKVFDMYQHRIENYYKTDVLLAEEELFNEEELSVKLARKVVYGSEKKWKSTISLLKYLAQFAVTGQISCWAVDNGVIVEQLLIEPHSDKAAVQAFLKGRELVKEEGKEKEAMDALSKAIQKYERHALAYERRGFINYQLKNYNDALYDFTKSINIYSNNPDPYFGRANIYILKNELEKAVADLDKSIKKSIPLQPIYWKSRRIKGEILIKLGDMEGAAREFRMFIKRKFSPDDTNFKWKKYTLTKYGQVLLELGDLKEAVNAFNEAVKLEQAGAEKIQEADPLLYRGIALQKAGKSGYKKDWKKAAKLGSERAAQLIEEYTR